MDETILFPSPNWFQVSGLAVTSDGWLIYGGPSKSLCVLQPLPSSYDAVVRGRTGYKAHVLNRTNPEKIICVDVSPEWPEKRTFVTGSIDGTVKTWLITEQDDNVHIKASFVHDVHSHLKEELVGIGYNNDTIAISVGSYANVVKWDTNSNVTKVYPHFMKNFKPTCVSVSRHKELNVAIGTRQGVVFLIDLTGKGNIVYKIRAHDDDILQLNWCPQYKVEVRKSLNYSLASRLDRIRTQQDTSKDDSNLSKVISADKFTSIDFNKTEKVNTAENTKTEVLNTSISPKATDKKAENLNKPGTSGTAEVLNSSELNSTVVEEDDLFDMYKDHAAEEFGHKKFEPENILVKIKSEETEPNDFLAECLKLKDDILKNKTQSEATIESLVEALDKTHVDSAVEAKVKEGGKKCDDDDEGEDVGVSDGVTSVHVQRHLLVTIARQGSIRIWSKSGKLVSSGMVNNGILKGKTKPTCLSVFWHKPDCLLITDGKDQLLECNPLKVDSKTKLEWRLLHSMHRRGLFCVASGAPRVQTDSDVKQHWPVWTAAQDRNMVEYCVKERRVLAVHATAGSYVYWVAVCPYDARKVAASVSDGAVRVWEADTLQESDSHLSQGHVAMYWHNVQGKVFCVAWHPTRENVLAFATGEARVGLIDTSGKNEKPARVLRPALNNAIYGLCWGEGNTLYACGGGELVAYRTERPDDAPKPIKVEVDGVQWKISEVLWTPRALLLGSVDGAVAVLTASAPHTVVTQAFPFTKMIHQLDWHPQQVSESSEESPNKDLIAACSLEKGNIVVLRLSETEDGDIKLSTHSTLCGHKGIVNKVCWNPHREALLLSSSQDGTVRAWNVAQGACISIFGAHKHTTLGIAWSGHPARWDRALSGGGDACLRMWRLADHLPDMHVETKIDTYGKKEKRKYKDKETAKEATAENGESDKDETESDHPAVQQVHLTSKILDNKLRTSKKFLIPRIYKQIKERNPKACRMVWDQYLERNGIAKEVNGGGDEKRVADENGVADKCGVGDEIGDGDQNGVGDKNGVESDSWIDFIKIFGSINDVNEVMDKELQRHKELDHHENWMVLSIFRGNIDSVFQYATQRDIICPYLLSIAPCVSYKYWKDVTQLYLTQIDRLAAKGDEAKLAANKTFGGPVYRKAATLLSVHDVKGAVNVLIEGGLYTEAYVLCRVRHLDSIAEETLRAWAKYSFTTGAFLISAICSINLGDLAQAASVLGRSQEESYISLAAEIAKLSGQTSFATHCQEKTDKIKSDNENNKEVLEELKKLPSRMEALVMKGDGNGDGDVCEVSGGGDA